MRASPPASRDLADYGGLLRRRWRPILAAGVTGFLLGGGCLLAAPQTYTATASVLVTPTGVGDTTPLAHGRTPADVNLDTAAQIATSIVVARRARQLFPPERPPEELVEHVSVTVPPNSAVLEISFDAGRPALAEKGASAFATAYLRHRAERARSAVQRRQAALRKRLGGLTEQLEAAEDATGSPTPAYARQHRQVLIKRASELTTALGSLSVSTVTPGDIINGADRPRKPSGPRASLFLATGLMSGFLVGTVTAVARDRVDHRIRRAADVARLTELPVLLDLPLKRGQARELVPARSTFGQRFHELCHSVVTALGHGNHILLVTSPSPGTGTSVVAANLAAALTRIGTSAALVCADPHCLESTHLLGVRQEPGLSDILVGQASPSRVEQRGSDLPQLRIIAPGTDDERLPEMLHGREMRRLLSDLQSSATYVIVETAPMSARADAQAFADAADAAIVVVEAAGAERTDVQRGVRQLDRMGTAVFGAVVLPSQSGATARGPASP